MRIENGDRRAVPRVRSTIAAFGHIIGSTSEARWAAQLSDLSVAGARVRLSFPLTVGTALTLQLRSDDRRHWCTLRAKIVHIRPVSGTEWVAGCAFDHALSREARRAFFGVW
jgi:hypothetical protein